jgi:Flp pilus assembly protein TadG
MKISRERGAVAVEFALVVPLLVLFLFGIIEGGTRYTQQSEVNHWAFLVARDLSIDPTKNATTLVNALKGSDSTSYTVTATGNCTTAGTTAVTVTVSASHTSPSGMFGNYTVKGKGVARCEN